MPIKLTQEAFIFNVKAIHGDKYSFKNTEYITARIPVIITCVKHQYDFKVVPSTLIGKKKKSERKYRVGSCPLCIKEYFDDIKHSKVFKIKKPRLIITKNPFNKKSYMQYDELKRLVNALGITSHWEYRKWRKRSCHEEDTPCNPDRVYCGWISYYDFFNTNKHSKMSAGERKIYNYLQRNNIKFVWQKKFEDCRNIHMLLFDFYLPRYNLLVEFDGQQHYKIANFSKSIEINKQKFEQVKKNDAIKTKYCKDKNIKLLRLNNDDLINNIAEMLLDIEIMWKY
jgi:very-short-patch-repair endonuclease